MVFIVSGYLALTHIELSTINWGRDVINQKINYKDYILKRIKNL
jgi:hypothetical protein